MSRCDCRDNESEPPSRSDASENPVRLRVLRKTPGRLHGQRGRFFAGPEPAHLARPRRGNGLRGLPLARVPGWLPSFGGRQPVVVSPPVFAPTEKNRDPPLVEAFDEDVSPNSLSERFFEAGGRRSFVPWRHPREEAAPGV